MRGQPLSDKTNIINQTRSRFSPVKVEDYKNYTRSIYNSASSKNKTTKCTSNTKTKSTSKDKKPEKQNIQLQYKLTTMQKTINKQEKLIKNLSKKIMNEKSQIGDLYYQHFHDKQMQAQQIESLEQKISDYQNIYRQSFASNTNSGIIAARKISRPKYDEDEQQMDYINTQKYHQQKKVKEVEQEEKVLEESGENEIGRNYELLVKELGRKLQEKEIENSNLQREICILKQSIRERDKLAFNELKSLRIEFDNLNEKNKLKSDQSYNYNDKIEISVLNKKIKELEDELKNKEKLTIEKEKIYQGQVKEVCEKMSLMQNELCKLKEFEEFNHSIHKQLELKNKEIEKIKKYYKEQLIEIEKDFKFKRNEWNSVYNELLDEIRHLKLEMDSLEIENKKLISNYASPSS